MKKIKNQIGVLIYTYDRIDDAKINMEIVRNKWSKMKSTHDFTIVHAYSGEKAKWPKKYLEDELVYIKNETHFVTASKLLDAGINIFRRKFSGIEYVVALAADTWIIKPEFIIQMLSAMKSENKYLATCGWAKPVASTRQWQDMATDFFAVNLSWAIRSKFFPLRYQEFLRKYQELLLYRNGSSIVHLEPVAMLRFKLALIRGESFATENDISRLVDDRILLLAEREPVLQSVQAETGERKVIREMYCEQIGLLSHHNLKKKKELLKKIEVKASKLE